MEPICAVVAKILGRLDDPRKDLREFVPIPGGTYNFKERGTVNMTPFDIGKYPVTIAWLGEFIAAGGYNTPELRTPQGQK